MCVLLALLLSRYDREVAAALFEPVAAFVRSRPFRVKNDLSSAVLLGLACLSPNEAVGVVESLPPAPTLEISQPTNWARVNLAEHLAMPPKWRWMRIWRFHAGCGIAMFEEVYRDLSFEEAARSNEETEIGEARGIRWGTPHSIVERRVVLSSFSIDRSGDPEPELVVLQIGRRRHIVV